MSATINQYIMSRIKILVTLWRFLGFTSRWKQSYWIDLESGKFLSWLQKFETTNRLPIIDWRWNNCNSWWIKES
jgi:hypothetical protein